MVPPGMTTAAAEQTQAITRVSRLAFASARVRSDDNFDGMLILGIVGDDGLQTWYGKNELVVQIDHGRLVHSRSLPIDVVDSFAASNDSPTLIECGPGRAYASSGGLFYTRLRGHKDYVVEMRRSIRCSVEEIVTPAYAGIVLKIESSFQIGPHPKQQVRTIWINPYNGAWVKLAYGEHPLYPSLSIVSIKSYP